MILAGVHAGAEASPVPGRGRGRRPAAAPQLVQIHRIGEDDGRPFLELEYVDGGSLDRRLDGTPWPAQRAAELVEALAAALPRRTVWASSTAT